jgi:thioredoxin reductase (NADPH)
MSEKQVYDNIIIGGGPAGLAAAIYCSRSKLRTLVIDKNPLAGALSLAGWIENYPGIPEPIAGTELLSRIRQQAQRLGAEIIRDEVIGVDFNVAPREIMTNKGSYFGKTVIIASGAMGRKPNIKGEAEYIGKGVAYCAECDAPLFEGQDVVVFGRPDLLQEELPQIARFAKHVYLVPVMLSKTVPVADFISDPKIEILQDHTVSEISGNSFVTGICLKDKSGVERKIEASGVFLYLQGRVPVVKFLGDTLKLNGDNCILVNREDMKTSIEGVYAAGDVTCKKIRQSIIATAEGSLAAISAMSYIIAQQKSTPSPVI